MTMPAISAFTRRIAHLTIAASISTATAVDVPITDDAMVISNNASFNYGAHVNLNVSSLSTSVRWAYLKFNLNGFVPPGTVAADIDRAVLRVYVNNVTTPGSISMHSITSLWVEGKANGAGSAGTITWNLKPTNDATAETTFSVAEADTDEFITFDVTDLVKDWLTTPASNLGIVLKPSGTVNVGFDSKENTTNSKQPTLDITLAKKRTPARGDVSMGPFTAGPQP